jgi:FAD/FMN-containing dehydrogenase
MMRDAPDGTTLLRHARALLLEQLLPALPEDRHYPARLLAKALAIAAAEQTAGKAPLEAEADALAELYGERRTPAAREAEAVEDILLRLNWRLAAEIRGGTRDGDAQVYALLRSAMLARLREVNPKALEAAGEGPSD